MKAGRKDAHPDGLLAHSDIYSEARREAFTAGAAPLPNG